MPTQGNRPEPPPSGKSPESEIRETKRRSVAAGGLGRPGGEIGEVPQSKRYKIIVGVIVLIIAALVISDCIDGESPPTTPRTLQSLAAPNIDLTL
jgi:hypothetical protein